ncbi:MAG: hypothetical protein ABR562_04635 [Thermoplasmatota archaeon]|nr:hypothetical protein [Halobacteriales archaeon]
MKVEANGVGPYYLQLHGETRLQWTGDTFVFPGPDDANITAWKISVSGTEAGKPAHFAIPIAMETLEPFGYVDGRQIARYASSPLQRFSELAPFFLVKLVSRELKAGSAISETVAGLNLTYKVISRERIDVSFEVTDGASSPSTMSYRYRIEDLNAIPKGIISPFGYTSTPIDGDPNLAWKASFEAGSQADEVQLGAAGKSTVFRPYSTPGGAWNGTPPEAGTIPLPLWTAIAYARQTNTQVASFFQASGTKVLTQAWYYEDGGLSLALPTGQSHWKLTFEGSTRKIEFQVDADKWGSALPPAVHSRTMMTGDQPNPGFNSTLYPARLMVPIEQAYQICNRTFPGQVFLHYVDEGKAALLTVAGVQEPGQTTYSCFNGSVPDFSNVQLDAVQGTFKALPPAAGGLF